MAQEVRMLGTGNAFLPYGRLHSFAMIDGKHIIDCPPTALASLRREGIVLSDIETIFITHVHADHVFGFPFFLLERRYISDRGQEKPLTVVAAPGVKEHLLHLCQLAYPGSLDEVFSTIQWREESEGTLQSGLTWKRFRVLHDESVDPFGYHFDAGTDGSFVHSGDSGPCRTLYDELEATNMAIIEMGIPDWVDSPHHHTPTELRTLAQSNPSLLMVVTHTFIDQPGIHPVPTVTDVYPEHPSNVVHAEDGLLIQQSSSSWSVV
tara:strand:- start:54380 stop:55171 length:792 start_codon:yes stop_codon:yes gene_type:complete